MFCSQCGKELKPADKFCPDCGTAKAPVFTSPEILPAATMPQQQFYTDIPQKTKKRRKWPIVLVITLTSILLIALAVFFIFFRHFGPLLSLGRALNNLSVEAEERFNSTPLVAITMLSEILKDGTIIADIDYTTAIFFDWLTADISARVKLSSNTDTRNFSLEAQVGAYGENIDIDAHMNRERLALRFQLLGDEFYGLRYNTFREDIRILGNLIRLNSDEMNRLADIVDKINEMVNAEEVDDDTTSELFSQAFSKFFRNLKISSSRSNTLLAGERQRITIIMFTVTKETLIALLNDIYDILDNNESLKAQSGMLDNPLLHGITGDDFSTDYDQLLREFRSAIDELELYYSGDITATFHIGKDDKLLQVFINADIEYNGESSEFLVNFVFGNPTVNWTFFISNTTANYTDVVTVVWSQYTERSSVQVDNLNISISNRNETGSDINSFNSIDLTSTWYQDTGDITLRYLGSEDFEFESTEITGNFTTGEKSFRLILDDIFPDNASDSLRVDISARPGSQFEEIDYVNIDRWGISVFETIARLLLSGLLS